MSFPKSVSFTLTNRCNLRCRMCGQWSEEGYMHGAEERLASELKPDDWKRLADELAAHGLGHVLVRGGEPFMAPGIVELLEHFMSRNLFVPIDTNGTLIGRYAEDIVRLGRIHLTVSVDGPEEIHDEVRGVKGCFARTREGLARLAEVEKSRGVTISKAICFVISPYSVRGLSAMPDVARSLGIGTIAIVPYYYMPADVGREYERVLRNDLGCSAFSWCGFHHDDSGMDFELFREQYRKYLAGLDGIQNYPYMAFSEDEYRTWFADPRAPVGRPDCPNVERLLDIQPDGNANFCVDFPDYTVGNVRESTIEELWNSKRAERFRACRRAGPLPVCHRCGSKYMSA